MSHIIFFFLLPLIHSTSFRSLRRTSSGPVEVNVSYAGDEEDKDSTLTFYYDDAYFTKSSETYDPSLATMSVGLAFSAFNSADADDWEDSSQNIQALLTELNFSSITVNKYYKQAPENYSIGVCAGYKTITAEDEDGNSKNYTLIAVGIRGSSYHIEWVSNMYIGETGHHAGFYIAKLQVLEFLKNFTSDNNITGDVKIWMAGFSRAGATTDLVCADIAEDGGSCIGDSVSVAPTDIYAYTFEAPCARSNDIEAKDPSYYVGIHNIINPNDLVPIIPFSQLGFSRFGNDHIIPNRQSNSDYDQIVSKMKEIFVTLPGTSGYTLDDFKIKQLKQFVLESDNTADLRTAGAFYQDFANTIAQQVGTRTVYMEKYQQDIMNLLYFYEQDPGLAALLVLLSYAVSYIQSGNTTADTDYETIIALTIQTVAPTFEYSVCYATVHSVSSLINTFATEYVANRANLLTILKQITVVGSGHNTELVYAWAALMDENYQSSADSSSSASSTAFSVSSTTSASSTSSSSSTTSASSTAAASNNTEASEEAGSAASSSSSTSTARSNRKATTNSYPYVSYDSAMTDGSFRIVQISSDVDVQVLDSTGALIGMIANGTVYNTTTAHPVMGVDDDGYSFIHLPAEAAYTLSLNVSLGSSFNYSIHEFNTTYHLPSRVVMWTDVSPLLIFTAYTGIIPAKSGNTTEYQLLSTFLSAVSNSSDVTGDDAVATRCYVSAATNDSAHGTAYGTGFRTKGVTALLYEVPKENTMFVGWYNGTECIGTSAYLQISVAQNETITAKFRYLGDEEDSEESTQTKIVVTSLSAVLIIAIVAIIALAISLCCICRKPSRSRSEELPRNYQSME